MTATVLPSARRHGRRQRVRGVTLEAERLLGSIVGVVQALALAPPRCGPPAAADHLQRVQDTIALRVVERLRARLDLGSAATAELTAAAGFDAVIVDLEHGVGDEAAARGQIAAAGGPVLVRTPDGGTQAGRMLDAGAPGVIFPRVASVDAARELAQAVRYAGSRGVSPFARSNRWGAGGGAWRAEADARGLRPVHTT
jgi:hypothetical protein